MLILPRMQEFSPDYVAELHRQTAFGAAILGGFAVTFLSALLSAFAPDRRIGTWAVGFTAAAAVLLIVATLAATVGLLSVQSLGLNHFDFARWPAATVRAKWVGDVSFFAGICVLLVGIGLSGWVRSRTTGIVTGIVAGVGLVLLIVISGAAF